MVPAIVPVNSKALSVEVHGIPRSTIENEPISARHGDVTLCKEASRVGTLGEGYRFESTLKIAGARQT